MKGAREIANYLFKEVKVERITCSMGDYNKPALRFATLMGQHVTFGWDERGPQYDRFMKYTPKARPGASQHS